MRTANLLLIIYLVSTLSTYAQNSIIFTRTEFKNGNPLSLQTILEFDSSNSQYYVPLNEKNTSTLEGTKLSIGEKYQFLDTIYRLSLDTKKVIAARHTITGKNFCVLENNILSKCEFYDTEKQILGYRCKLAKTMYNGVSYLLWYTENLKFPFGPNKIGGLPGIILEVYDEDKKIVHIIANEISVDKEKQATVLNLKICTNPISFNTYNQILQKEISENNDKVFELINSIKEKSNN